MTSLTSTTERVTAGGVRAQLAVAVRAMRPRQWTKNVLLLAALLFAGKAAEAALWPQAIGAVIAFCALSSAVYVVNDIHDVRQDRLHPTKRLRPLASGDLSIASGVCLAALLVSIAFAVGAVVGSSFVVLLAVFAALQAAYTFALKRVPIVDVAAIALGFALRAAAGAAAVDVRTSAWLIVCTILLACFLGFAKRRGELVHVRAAGGGGRSVLALYTQPLLDVLAWVTALAAVASYVVYTVVARDQAELLATVPFVAFGVARYLQLVHRRDLGEEPEVVLLSDVPILLTVTLWALTAMWILTTS
jgi:4-hydroxybenzoate polyprenyltransferase